MSWFVCFLMSRQPRKSQRTDTLLPYPPRFRSAQLEDRRIPARRRTLATAALEDLICQGRQQRLLVGEVVIERGGLYAELTAQATHRQVSQPIGVEHRQGPIDDVGPAIAQRVLPPRYSGVRPPTLT